jgi:tetratricopeptide (TPR) repeat protein
MLPEAARAACERGAWVLDVRKRAILMSRSSGDSPSRFKRVESLDPSTDMPLPRFVEGVYLPRPADDAARQALRQAARSTRTAPRQPLGICVTGRAMLGKTRLAWEAMRAELTGWTFVPWPRGPQASIDFAALHSKRAVLWIDQAQTFANPHEALLLNSLPEAFAAAGVRLVVVMTCRDGASERAARQHLEPLLARLTTIPLTEMSAAEADQLVALLKAAGVEAHQDQFDGTPGSILLDVAGLRNARYPALPESARSVLGALKLLHQVGIVDYPAPRVRATAVDLFALDEHDWQNALDALAQAGFVRLGEIGAGGEQALASVAEVYLERAVLDEPSSGEEGTDAWLQLAESLLRHQDAEALFKLGLAFGQRSTGDLRANRHYAGACYRAALEVYTRQSAPIAWALMQNALGDALKREADLLAGAEQAALLAQAVAAHRAALEVFSRNTLPAGWALAQNNLGNALSQRARLAVGAERIGLLGQALAAYHAALEVRTRERLPAAWAATQSNLGQALGVQAQLLIGAERASLLEQEVACYQAALEVYTRQNAPDAWAAIQNNLGNALRTQAEQAEKAARSALLSQAVSAYRAALEVYTREETPALWAMVHSNLGIALSAQADSVYGMIREVLLMQAIEAYRAALEVRTRQSAPAAWAMTQSNLGAALRGRAGHVAGQERADVLGLAAQVYRAALTVYTREGTPIAWAGTHFNLALIHLDRATTLEPEDKSAACQALREAWQSIHQALSVYSEEIAPANHQQAADLRERIARQMQASGCKPGA